jgi:hypothetical protein
MIRITAIVLIAKHSAEHGNAINNVDIYETADQKPPSAPKSRIRTAI